MTRIPFNPYDFFGYLASGLVLVVGMNVTLGFPPVLGADFHMVEGALLVVAVYVAGQLVATPAKALLEDGMIHKVLDPPSVNLFRDRKPRLRGFLFPGYYKPLPKTMRARILSLAEAEGLRERGEALFLHVRFSPEIRTDEKLMVRLNSFLNNYGFARNLAFTTFLVGLSVGIRSFQPGSEPTLSGYAVTVLLVSILLFYRYLKFFRQYSYELFNTYGGLRPRARARGAGQSDSHS